MATKNGNGSFRSYLLMGAGFATGAAIVSTIVALIGVGAKNVLEQYEARYGSLPGSQKSMNGAANGNQRMPY